MSDISNGVRATDLTDARWVRWVKSRHSGPTGGNCVEVASLAGGVVAVRNSRHPAGPALILSAPDWDAFVGSIKDGDFG